MPLIYISNSPPQVGRCSRDFQLGMRNTKKIHQTKEITRRDAGNTSAEKIVIKQVLIQKDATITQG